MKAEEKRTYNGARLLIKRREVADLVGVTVTVSARQKSEG